MWLQLFNFNYIDTRLSREVISKKRPNRRIYLWARQRQELGISSSNTRNPYTDTYENVETVLFFFRFNVTEINLLVTSIYCHQYCTSKNGWSFERFNLLQE